MTNTPPLVQLDRLTEHSFRAYQEGFPVFTIRDTTAGWKTEGHPAGDGLLCESMDDLIANLEGRTR